MGGDLFVVHGSSGSVHQAPVERQGSWSDFVVVYVQTLVEPVPGVITDLLLRQRERYSLCAQAEGALPVHARNNGLLHVPVTLHRHFGPGHASAGTELPAGGNRCPVSKVGAHVNAVAFGGHPKRLGIATGTFTELPVRPHFQNRPMFWDLAGLVEIETVGRVMRVPVREVPLTVAAQVPVEGKALVQVVKRGEVQPAAEILITIGDAPDWIFEPVANGLGNGMNQFAVLLLPFSSRNKLSVVVALVRNSPANDAGMGSEFPHRLHRVFANGIPESGVSDFLPALRPAKADPLVVELPDFVEKRVPAPVIAAHGDAVVAFVVIVREVLETTQELDRVAVEVEDKPIDPKRTVAETLRERIQCLSFRAQRQGQFGQDGIPRHIRSQVSRGARRLYLDHGAVRHGQRSGRNGGRALRALLHDPEVSSYRVRSSGTVLQPRHHTDGLLLHIGENERLLHTHRGRAAEED